MKAPSRKKEAHLKFKAQQRVVNDLKASWRSLIQDKASMKARAAARKRFVDAKVKLNSIRDEWREHVGMHKKARVAQQELAEAAQTLNEDGNTKEKKKALRALRRLTQEYPPASWFKIQLLPAATMRDSEPKVYLGRYHSGAPVAHPRIGFVMNVKTRKSMEPMDIRKKLEEYFSSNTAYFGQVQISMITGGPSLWSIGATTNNREIIGFWSVPRPVKEIVDAGE